MKYVSYILPLAIFKERERPLIVLCEKSRTNSHTELNAPFVACSGQIGDIQRSISFKTCLEGSHLHHLQRLTWLVEMTKERTTEQ